jgi:hypothetical protein
MIAKSEEQMMKAVQGLGDPELHVRAHRAVPSTQLHVGNYTTPHHARIIEIPHSRSPKSLSS